MKHERLHLGGMTCVNCHHKIEQKLRSTAGVESASVSYGEGIADIVYDPAVLSRQDSEGVIAALGYTVQPGPQSGQGNVGRTVCLLVIVICLYILLQRFGILNLLAPSQLAETGMGYGMLFVTGLLTSVHCIAMCGGINLSQCIPRQGAEAVRGGAVGPALLYNLGRVLSYTAIGFLLGLVGYCAGGGGQTGLSALWQGVLKLIAGALMVVMGAGMLELFPGLRRWTPRLPRAWAARLGARRARARRPFAVGLLNGLMPCGPLQSMQIVALATGNPLSGALSMLLFSLGTVPLMLGLGAAVSALGKRFARAVTQVGAVLVVVLGLAMLAGREPVRAAAAATPAAADRGAEHAGRGGQPVLSQGHPPRACGGYHGLRRGGAAVQPGGGRQRPRRGERSGAQRRPGAGGRRAGGQQHAVRRAIP